MTDQVATEDTQTQQQRLARRLHRVPEDFEDAKTLIRDLQHELSKRPQLCVIDPRREPDILAADRLGVIGASSSGLRIEITTNRGCKYVFQSCVLVETPDVVCRVEAVRDISGNIMSVPTTVERRVDD